MDIKKKQVIFSVIILLFATLACGLIEVGVVTPTADDSSGFINDQDGSSETDLEDPGQTPTPPEEDFSNLWVEYWNPVFDYGLAIPNHWRVETNPQGGYLMLWSYEQEFFDANSIKGWWVGGEPPEGAVKIDIAPLEVEVPEQSLEVVISNRDNLGDWVVLSVEKATFGAAEGAYVTKARKENLEDTNLHIEIRLSPETILSVGTFPDSRLYSSDIQLILNSLVVDKNTPIVKPTAAPYPPLSVNSEITEPPSYAYAKAWFGQIASLPEGDPYDDKVILQPEGTGEFGVKGNTAEIEAQIQSLRDSRGINEYVHMWGVLYCNIDDYNTCQLNVDRLEYEGEYTVGVEPIDNWVGKIYRTTWEGDEVYGFVLSGQVPIWYGIASPNDQAIQDQIESLADTDTVVSIWGDLFVGVDDLNGVRIEVNQIDPPAPGALPSSGSCESGYLGSVEEAVEFIQYNLEIGNFGPFSYFIGNPFVIGYWQSEGIAIPREDAYQQLVNNYLPSPEEVVVISDKADYPSESDLFGIPIESIFGPDVDVSATLYSKGWGEDGRGEAIIYITRCSGEVQEAYYWYGIVYAGNGFSRQ